MTAQKFAWILWKSLYGGKDIKTTWVGLQGNRVSSGFVSLMAENMDEKTIYGKVTEFVAEINSTQTQTDTKNKQPIVGGNEKKCLQ